MFPQIDEIVDLALLLLLKGFASQERRGERTSCIDAFMG